MSTLTPQDHSLIQSMKQWTEGEMHQPRLKQGSSNLLDSKRSTRNTSTMQSQLQEVLDKCRDQNEAELSMLVAKQQRAGS